MSDDDDPLTPEIVHRLLKEALRNSQCVPSPKSEEVERLTASLNRLREYAKYRSTILPKETETVMHIGDAIENLIEDLPKIREKYVVTLEGAERWGLATESAKANLEAIDQLMAAAQAARELGLPLLPHAYVLGMPAERWTGCARYLAERFEEATNASKEAGYRFIAAVAPRITGEGPTPGYVKKELITKKKC